MRRPIAIVTGASRGIGLECARILVTQGYDVIGTSRNPDAIPTDRRLSGVRYKTLDVSSRSSIEAFCEDISHTDLLINNAGLSQLGAVEDISYETVENLFQTNLFGAIYLDKHFAKSMRIHGSGRIIHVSSLAARTPVPFSSIYAATKAALDAFAYSFSNEVHRYNIIVSNVFFDFVNTTLPQQQDTDETSVYASQIVFGKQLRDREIRHGMSAESVAKSIIAAALSTKSRLFIPIGSRTKRRYLLSRILPVSFIQARLRKRYIPQR